MPKGNITMNLRLPPDLHAVLKAVAEREDRSVNNLIVHVLRQRFTPATMAKEPDPKPKD